MPPNQINFENLQFHSFYNESFSDTEGERDPDENFFHEVITENFEHSYLFPNEIESFLSAAIHAVHVNKPEYGFSMPQVSKQMQVGHAYPLSRLCAYYLLRGYKKVPAKNCQ